MQNPRIKKAVRLFTSRGRQTQGRIIVFGQREVSRGIASGLVFEEIFLKETVVESTIRNIAFPQEANVFTVSDEVFAKVRYGDRDEGVVAIAARPNTDLENVKLLKNGLVVVAEAIEKPGNLGAIARTADACGASAIILADPLTDFYHPNAIRSSTGTLFSQQLASGTTAQVQSWLSANAVTVFPAIVEEATSLYDVDLTGNCAIVVGNEANGLSNEWRSKECCPVKLPMNGIADSLNASVTASVMLYEAFRQRRNAAKNS